MAQPWVESKVRDRVARIVVLSLVIGYSAAASLRLANLSVPTSPVVIAKPVEASFAPIPRAPTVAKAPRAVKREETTEAAWPVNPDGHLVVNAKEILLTDHRRVRVGELPFRPVKKALIGFQKTTKMPTVTLTASAEVPTTHVNVVKKFVERFYGWKVNTVASDKAGTFELDVAPAQGVTP